MENHNLGATSTGRHILKNVAEFIDASLRKNEEADDRAFSLLLSAAKHPPPSEDASKMLFSMLQDKLVHVGDASKSLLLRGVNDLVLARRLKVDRVAVGLEPENGDGGLAAHILELVKLVLEGLPPVQEGNDQKVLSGPELDAVRQVLSNLDRALLAPYVTIPPYAAPTQQHPISTNLEGILKISQQAVLVLQSHLKNAKDQLAVNFLQQLAYTARLPLGGTLWARTLFPDQVQEHVRVYDSANWRDSITVPVVDILKRMIVKFGWRPRASEIVDWILVPGGSLMGRGAAGDDAAASLGVSLAYAVGHAVSGVAEPGEAPASSGGGASSGVASSNPNDVAKLVEDPADPDKKIVNEVLVGVMEDAVISEQLRFAVTLILAKHVVACERRNRPNGFSSGLYAVLRGIYGFIVSDAGGGDALPSEEDWGAHAAVLVKGYMLLREDVVQDTTKELSEQIQQELDRMDGALTHKFVELFTDRSLSSAEISSDLRRELLASLVKHAQTRVFEEGDFVRLGEYVRWGFFCGRAGEVCAGCGSAGANVVTTVSASADVAPEVSSHVLRSASVAELLGEDADSISDPVCKTDDEEENKYVRCFCQRPTPLGPTTTTPTRDPEELASIIRVLGYQLRKINATNLKVNSLRPHLDAFLHAPELVLRLAARVFYSENNLYSENLPSAFLLQRLADAVQASSEGEFSRSTNPIADYLAQNDLPLHEDETPLQKLYDHVPPQVEPLAPLELRDVLRRLFPVNGAVGKNLCEILETVSRATGRVGEFLLQPFALDARQSGAGVLPKLFRTLLAALGEGVLVSANAAGSAGVDVDMCSTPKLYIELLKLAKIFASDKHQHRLGDLIGQNGVAHVIKFSKNHLQQKDMGGQSSSNIHILHLQLLARMQEHGTAPLSVDKEAAAKGERLQLLLARKGVEVESSEGEDDFSPASEEDMALLNLSPEQKVSLQNENAMHRLQVEVDRMQVDLWEAKITQDVLAPFRRAAAKAEAGDKDAWGWLAVEADFFAALSPASEGRDLSATGSPVMQHPPLSPETLKEKLIPLLEDDPASLLQTDEGPSNTLYHALVSSEPFNVDVALAKVNEGGKLPTVSSLLDTVWLQALHDAPVEEEEDPTAPSKQGNFFCERNSCVSIDIERYFLRGGRVWNWWARTS